MLADRAYGNAVGDQALERLGITDSVIPRAAAPIQYTRAWRRRYRYRSGVEGRISGLKRGRGRARSRLKGHAGATIWAGHGVFTHNLAKWWPSPEHRAAQHENAFAPTGSPRQIALGEPFFGGK